MPEKDLKDPYVAAGSKLKTLRTDRGWTQKEVAEKMEITEGFLSFLESGTKHGSLDTYRDLSALYDFPLPDLFDQGKDLKTTRQPTVALNGLSADHIKLVQAMVRAFRSRR